MYNIFISPGHYEYTWEKEHAKGIVADDGLFQEFNDFNIKVPIYLNPLLKQHPDIFKIHQLEYDNNKLDKTLRQRIDFINANCCMNDIIVSIHANYNDNFNVKGLWLLYSGSKSKKLVDLYIKHSKENLIPYTRTYKCTIKEKWLNLGIVLKTNCPVILIEAGFFSNKQDRAILKSSKYQKEVAISIYKMICEYYGIEPILARKDLKHIEAWKMIEVEKAVKYGFIDSDIWARDIDGMFPRWAVLEMLNDEHELFCFKLDELRKEYDSKFDELNKKIS